MKPLTSKQQHWQRIIEQCSASGLSQAEFCRENEIKPQSLYQWRHALAQKSKSAEAPATFIPLVVEPPIKTNPVVKVSIGSIDVQYEAGTDDTLFLRVVTLLGSSA